MTEEEEEEEALATRAKMCQCGHPGVNHLYKWRNPGLYKGECLKTLYDSPGVPRVCQCEAFEPLPQYEVLYEGEGATPGSVLNVPTEPVRVADVGPTLEERVRVYRNFWDDTLASLEHRAEASIVEGLHAKVAELEDQTRDLVEVVAMMLQCLDYFLPEGLYGEPDETKESYSEGMAVGHVRQEARRVLERAKLGAGGGENAPSETESDGD